MWAPIAAKEQGLVGDVLAVQDVGEFRIAGEFALVHGGKTIVASMLGVRRRDANIERHEARTQSAGQHICGAELGPWDQSRGLELSSWIDLPDSAEESACHAMVSTS